MLKHKRIRQKGKISLSKYFQKFDSGDFVAVSKELSVQSPGFSNRIQGRTGRVIERKGGAYVVEIKDYNMPKRYSIRPIHLKRIKIAK